MLTRSTIRAVATVALLVPSAALGGGTLYDDMGGAPVVDAMVDGLVDRLLTDERTAPTFAQSDIPRIREKLKLQICEVADGPCVYDGLSMADSHMGHELTEAHFNAMVELMRDAMAEEGIGFRTQNRLLVRLAPMHDDVVTAR